MAADLDPGEYRKVVGRFATGVTVITTVVDGQHYAMTCNSFTSVSLDPVMVLFCAERVARFHDRVLAASGWGVSVLARGQQPLSRRFAARGRPLRDQFAGVPHRTGAVTGAALLDGAIAWLECCTTGTIDGGDHTVVVGEVLRVESSDLQSDPLLYFQGRYGTFEAE